MSGHDEVSWRDKLENAIRKNLLTLLVGFLLFGVIVAGVVLASYYSMFNGSLSDSQGVWGQFGDFVGGALNPLFAFLSFVALLMTLLIQNKELENSYKELKKSTNALSQQSKALDLQNFERTFFELIRLHHEIVNGVVINGNTPSVSGGEICFENYKHQGRECFSDFYAFLASWYRNVLEEIDKSKPIQNQIEDAYEKFTDRQNNSISHYFRNLYHIFKFIDESSVDNKKWYTSIVRAQLSSPELCLLFYNALLPQYFKAKILIEKYAILENMNFDELIDKDQHLPLYNIAAYGDALTASQLNKLSNNEN